MTALCRRLPYVAAGVSPFLVIKRTATLIPMAVEALMNLPLTFILLPL
ncbi:hypothetical protein MQ089_05315 [Edwardsiella anguillarum]|nr:hypothetical protein [Edwardsiella anguillarum]WHP81292.1 hypothetical protein MQ090_05295 [Edwardsiella anguillarum]WHQ18793.1 hypothetical protein MQ085_05315 [Edwardsiella anguillarum]WHQ22335.1 hypothetical protein MQ089_05315 [Edwardsiella anguillarum]WHQ25857.1 hypothetical protein MQ094_05315 [Edwardsiella anguillarum]WHQ29380.1 hypothetical protein MQ093_05320 [Edwardsiella anguillarum]